MMNDNLIIMLRRVELYWVGCVNCSKRIKPTAHSDNRRHPFIGDVSYILMVEVGAFTFDRRHLIISTK